MTQRVTPQIPITIRQGATWELPLSWKIDGAVVDLSTWSARMQVRVRASSTAAVLSLTNGDGIDLAATGWNVILRRSATQTANLAPRDYVFDVELVEPAGRVWPWIAGVITVEPEVTRS